MEPISVEGAEPPTNYDRWRPILESIGVRHLVLSRVGDKTHIAAAEGGFFASHGSTYPPGGVDLTVRACEELSRSGLL